MESRPQSLGDRTAEARQYVARGWVFIGLAIASWGVVVMMAYALRALWLRVF
jgi:hypothetical protein